MPGLEESIVDIRKKYPAMFELDSAGTDGNAASVFDVGDANAAGGSAYQDEFAIPKAPTADQYSAPAPPSGYNPFYKYDYQGYTGGGVDSGNFGGYEGVSGEGQPAPSAQQVEDRANFIQGRSAQVRAGLRGMDAPSTTDPRMAQIEQAIAQLRMPQQVGGSYGFNAPTGFSA